MTYEQIDDRKVILMGQTFLYQQKAPFMQSGMSVKGALEYDDKRDLVKCHECGGWFQSVGIHSKREHGISAREYKFKHGLRIATSLVSEGTRARYIRQGYSRINEFHKPRKAGEPRPGRARLARTWESKNEIGTCQAQLLSRISTLAARLGKTPSVDDMKANGISYKSLLSSFNVKAVGDVMSLVGLNPNPGADWYSTSQLREMLIDFYAKHGRPPSQSDFRRKLLPSVPTFVKYFGSMQAAWKAAGLEVAVQQRRQEAYRKRDERRWGGQVNRPMEGAA